LSETAVVDASLAAKWVIDEPHSDAALILLAEWDRTQTDRIVPCWFAAELAAVLFRRIRLGDLSVSQSRIALDRVLSAVTMVPESAPIAHRAVEIAVRLNQSRPYDSLYVALAEEHACDLWTADQRFFNAARGPYPWVRWIGEYEPA
jgi:predicted nucleic acid-binding protein